MNEDIVEDAPIEEVVAGEDAVEEEPCVPPTYYIRRADGSLSIIAYEDCGYTPVPTLSEGDVFLTKEEYDVALAEMQAANQAYLDALLAAERAQQKSDYDALIALGIPDAMARRMSGYTGP